MSRHTHGHDQPAPRTSYRPHRLCRGLIVLLTLGVTCALAPSALARFSVKALHVGSAAGAVDYLYTAGNKVVEQGSADRGSWYRFDVYDAAGAAHFHGACSLQSTNGSVSAAYPLQSTDPLSNAGGWRFEFREFSSRSNCTSGVSATHDGSLYFDVAGAKSYSSSALTSAQSSFGAGATAYVQVGGAGKVSNGKSNPGANGTASWSTIWLSPSGTPACANTISNAGDLPSSTANGQLPSGGSGLQYAPGSGALLDPWNKLSNYDVQSCPAFGSANQGQWRLTLSADTTHFVTLPVFTVNTTPPETTITSGESNTSASTSPAFTFTSSEAGSSFQCQIDGAAWSSCASPQAYSGLTNGTHAFSVRAIDPAGNVDPTPATETWRIDSTAPPVTLTKPAAGSYLNTAAPTFAGTGDSASGDSAVTVDVYSGTSVTGSLIQAQTAAVQADGTWTAGASPLPDGTYTVQAQQTDSLGRAGSSQQTTFIVDTAPPAVTVATPANGTHTNDATPEISGTAGSATSDLPTVAVAVTQGAATVESASGAVSSSGTWDLVLPTALPDGNYTLQASQKDQAGNTGNSSSQSLTIDTAAPQTFLDAAPVGVTSSTTATFSFHSNDDLSQTGSSFQCQLDGGAWGACTSPKSYFNLANGPHTLSVEAVDGAGNLDTAGQSATWAVNTSLPLITLGNPVEGSFTNQTHPTLSGTTGLAAGDSSTVHVLIYAGTDLSGSPLQTLTSTASNGSWSVSPTTALVDGTYVAYAQEAGTAGTATSAPHTFTVLTQAPTTTITLGPPGASGTGDAVFEFSSSAQGATFQCQLDGTGWIGCTSPEDYFRLADGAHTFQVRSIDRAGNVSSPATQTWAVNSSLPALSLSSPSDGTVTDNPAPAIAGTAGTGSGDAATITVKLYSGTSITGGALQTVTTTVSSSDGEWTTHPSPGLSDGIYTVYATQTGSAGMAYTAAHTFTVDTAPPSTTITSAPQGATSSTSARFTFSSSEAGSTFECQLDSGAWTACFSPKSYSGLTVAQHTFSVRATDPAGNVEASPPAASWTIDTATNIPLTLTNPADGTVSSNNAPTFSGTASSTNGNGISVEIDDADGNLVELLSTGSGSTWSLQASPSLPDGSYTAFASELATDGVTTDYSAVVGFTVDTTPPTTHVTSAPQGTTSSTSARFDFTSSEAGSTFQCKLDTGSWTPCSSPRSYSSLTSGKHSFSVRATDAAGNTDPTPALASWTIDTSTPLTLNTPADGSTTNATPTFSGRGSSANPNSISVEVVDSSGNVVELVSAGTGSSWSVKATPALPEGSYTAFASQLATDGVTADYSGTVSFTVDATAPILTLTSGPSKTSNDNTPSFGGALGTAVGDLANVTLKLYSGTAATGSPVQTIPATMSGSSWSASAARLPDGTYTARAEQPDGVGNVGYSAKRTFTVDTASPSGPTAPNTPSPSPGPGSGGTSTTPSTAGTPSVAAGSPSPAVHLSLRANRVLHLRRRAMRLLVTASCSKACSVLLTGKVVSTTRSKRGHRSSTRAVLVLRLPAAKLRPGTQSKLTIKVSAAARKTLLKALAGKRQLTLTLSGIASAPGTAKGSASLTIRLVV
jgi:hypothetical protein